MNVSAADPSRRRAARRAAVRTVVAVIALVAAYGVVPFAGRFGGATLVRTLVGLAVLVVVITWQLRTIQRATYPRIRAVVVVVLAAALCAVGFAALYLMASGGDAGAFNERLDHIDALYFSLSVFSTVGFGDVHAVSSTARVIVMLHIVTNVVLLAGAARAAFALAGAASPRPEA